MDKHGMVQTAREKLALMGIENEYGNGTDISISKEFMGTDLDPAAAGIAYEAKVFFDEKEQTVYMYEKVSQLVGGKLNEVQNGINEPSVVTTIPQLFQRLAMQNDWKYRTVALKEQAMYPAGYLPPFILPVYSRPVEKPAKAVTQTQTQNEDEVCGYCIECGAELTMNMSICKRCGKPVFL